MSNTEFAAQDWVYLKLQPYRQITVRKGKQHKLSSNFCRHFQLIKRIGQVAYKLKLPQSAKVHPVFYVSQLKKSLTHNSVMGTFSECDAQGLLAAEPIKLLGRKIVKQQNHMGVFGLIQWSNVTEDDATWENLVVIVKRYTWTYGYYQVVNATCLSSGLRSDSLFVLFPSSWTLHHVPFILYPSSCALHLVPFVIDPSSGTLHPGLFTLCPLSCALHPVCPEGSEGTSAICLTHASQTLFLGSSQKKKRLLAKGSLSRPRGEKS
nr:hypothetical protein [Tanacetum cinerariifolium]